MLLSIFIKKYIYKHSFSIKKYIIYFFYLKNILNYVRNNINIFLFYMKCFIIAYKKRYFIKIYFLFFYQEENHHGHENVFHKRIC